MNVLRIVAGLCLLGGLASILSAAEEGNQTQRPNVVIVLADDLGYGDPSCYGGKIATPHIDQFAEEGMRFTDAHTTSAVCSPTRYGLLTGRYNWRSKLQSGVLGGLSPPLIPAERMTIASMLKSQGYQTGCIGKWHLGMDWAIKPGKDVNELSIESREQVFNVDYSQPIKNGPNAVGFDYYFGISASLDMVPYTFIMNDHVTALPTEDRDFQMMKGRMGRHTRQGPAAPEFEAEQVLPTLAQQAVAFIERQSGPAKNGKPFFLYLPLNAPHTPILPTKEWFEQSGINPYADFVMQTDAVIGEVLGALQEYQLRENTLVIVTSDNGCSPQARFEELAAHGHHPSGPLRGHKADLFEGGLRVPFIARWPGQVPAGTTNKQLVCQCDLLATIAEIVGATIPPDAAEDSISFLKTLRTGEPAGRDSLVSHSINGSFAIRRGPWKLLLCPGSGGWSQPRPNSKKAKELPDQQLYNLAADLGEATNVIDQHPEQVAELTALLKRLVEQGRSTPGPKQSNDVPVSIRKNPSK